MLFVGGSLPQSSSLNQLPLISTQLGSYSLDAGAPDGDLTYIIEKDRKKLSKGDFNVKPLIGIGSLDIKKISYPFNLDVQYASLFNWYYLFLSKTIRCGLYKRSTPIYKTKIWNPVNLLWTRIKENTERKKST
uniref:ribosomal protein S2 n=1 Tax=Ishige okamurae TaxID=233772 RepID=UPI002E769EC2|nr:ribosomal protein S2 [Ishige okamurae]WBP70189.1 ribosomal protein S2 [Ishige okamurae]